MKVPLLHGSLTSHTLPEYVAFHRPSLLRACLLHGALLFRGFPDVDAPTFDAAVDALQLRRTSLVGSAAPRTHMGGSVYTANDSPPSEVIPFHHEMAQTAHPPSHVAFCCDVPAQSGGETPLLDSRQIAAFARVKFPHIYNRLAREGVLYRRVISELDDTSSPIGKGWRNVFDCDNRTALEHVLRRSDIDYEWRSNGDIVTTTSPMSAIRLQHIDGATPVPTFFNSILAAYNGWNDARNDGHSAVLHADGTALDADFMMALNSYASENKFEFPWRRGDVVLVDNRVTMHARNHFEPPRRVFAAIRTV